MAMHDGELAIDAALVAELVAEQLPHLGDLAIREIRSSGTVNAIFRLGPDLYARLPRMPHWASDLEKECRWLPTLAPRLPLRVPEPVALGRPTSAYPLPWAVYRWIEGEPFASELLTDERRAAQDLARFVAELRAAGPAFAALATRTVEEVLADAASDR